MHRHEQLDAKLASFLQAAYPGLSFKVEVCPSSKVRFKVRGPIEAMVHHRLISQAQAESIPACGVKRFPGIAKIQRLKWQWQIELPWGPIRERMLLQLNSVHRSEVEEYVRCCGLERERRWAEKQRSDSPVAAKKITTAKQHSPRTVSRYEVRGNVITPTWGTVRAQSRNGQ